MHVAAMIMAILVAVEHLFILWLEMFNADSEMAAKAFGIPRQTLQSPSVQLLFKNQGLYNGFLAVGILYSLFVIPAILRAGINRFAGFRVRCITTLPTLLQIGRAHV